MLLEGISTYHSFSTTMKFAHGANVGSTEVTWSATFVPVCDMGPPEDINQIAILAFKALACVAIQGNGSP
jgi:hypothetical protein